MGLKRQTKRHQNNTPICFAHLDKCNGIVLACWRSTLPTYGAGTVRPYFWDFLGAPWRWRTACRLGPPVLWRRRTFDRRIERCAPAVPQHDRARTSAIPLPAHRPCAAASQQSPVAIVPHGDVGCLVGFRQEGSAPSTPYMRCLIKWEDRFASFAQKVHNRCLPRRSSGGKLKCPSSSHRSSFQSASSRMSA